MRLSGRATRSLLKRPDYKHPRYKFQARQTWKWKVDSFQCSLFNYYLSCWITQLTRSKLDLNCGWQFEREVTKWKETRRIKLKKTNNVSLKKQNYNCWINFFFFNFFSWHSCFLESSYKLVQKSLAFIFCLANSLFPLILCSVPSGVGICVFSLLIWKKFKIGTFFLESWQNS